MTMVEVHCQRGSSVYLASTISGCRLELPTSTSAEEWADIVNGLLANCLAQRLEEKGGKNFFFLFCSCFPVDP